MPDDSVNLRAQSTDVDVSSITLEEKEMDKAPVEELAPGSSGTPQEGQGGGGPTTATWEAFFASVPGRGCVLYCLIYTALGLCLSTFGPVILDLSVQTGGTLRETGYCLIIRSLGYLGGSFLGFLYDRYPGHKLLSLAMALACIGTLGITWARSTFALAAVVSLQGIAMGLIDTGANLLLLWLFLDKSGPPMQAMHCAFAVGATMGPFLERFVESMRIGVGTRETTELVGVGAYNAAFYIIAALCALLCVTLLGVDSPKPRTTASASPEGEGGGTATTTTTTGDSSDPHAIEKWRIVGVVATLLGVYVGIETGYGSYLTAFSVLYVGSTEGTGQLLAGVYWGAIMVGRFASVFVASVLTPEKFLTYSMIGSTVSSMFLLAFGGMAAPLWMGSIAFGLGLACQYPTALTLVESFFPILGRHITMIMIGSASGEMVLPAIIASLFGGTTHGVDEVTGADVVTGGSPYVLMWVMAVFSIVNAGLLYFLIKLGHALKTKTTSTAPSTSAAPITSQA